MTVVNNLGEFFTNDVNTKTQVNEKEIQLLKLQIQEIQLKAKNPLGG